MARSIVVTDEYLETHLDKMIFINETVVSGSENQKLRHAILQYIPELKLYPENPSGPEFLALRLYLSTAESILSNTICGDINMGYIHGKVSKSHAYIKISAKGSNKLCGFALLNINFTLKFIEIFAICADKTYKGVGTYIIDCLLKLANQLNFNVIKLSAITNAVPFYLKNGFNCAEHGCVLILDLNRQTFPHVSINPSNNNEGKQRIIEKSNTIIQRLGTNEELDAMTAQTANMIAGLDTIVKRRKTITAEEEAAIAAAALGTLQRNRAIEGIELDWSPYKVQEKLFYACSTDKLGMLMQIVDAYPSVNLNKKDEKEETLLHVAVYRGSIHIVRYLWEKGADVNVALSEGNSLLFDALSGGGKGYGTKIDCLYFLLAGGPNNASYNISNDPIETIYYFATTVINPVTLEYLITRRIIDVVTPTGSQGLPLLLRVFTSFNIMGKLAGERLIIVITILNDLGADFIVTSTNGRTVMDLTQATETLRRDLNPEMIKVLREIVKVHESKKITGIEKHFLNACKCSDLSTVKDIFSKHPDMNYDIEELSNTGKTGLMYACRRGDLPLVKFLLEEVRPLSSGRGGGGGGGGEFRIDIDKKTEFGVTAFSEAILSENIELIDYLYERGADFSIANDVGGMNLLHLACLNMRSLDVIKRLVEQLHLDPDGQDSNGNTPLICLLKSSNMSLFRRLELIEYFSTKFPTGYVNFKYTLPNGDSVLTLAKTLGIDKQIVSFVEKTAEKSRKSSKAAIEKKKEVAQLLSEQSQSAKAVEVEEVLDSSNRSTKKAKPNASGTLTRRNSRSQGSAAKKPSQGSAKRSSQGSAAKPANSKGSAKTRSQGSAKTSIELV